MSTVPAKPGSGGLGFSSAWFAVAVAAVLAAAYPGVLVGSQTFFYRDFGVLAYPTLFHSQSSFWRGELALWNPESNCGAPFLAQWGTMVLYPFALFYWVLPLPWSANVFCLAHLVLAGAGMHRLALRWMGDPIAAWVAGAAFIFNGVTLSSLMWPNYTVALGWMPWVLLGVERAWLHRGRRSLALAAIPGVLQLLSGVPELVLMTWLLLAVLWVGAVVSGTVRWQSVGRVAAIIVLIAALAAVQLLPFLELLTHSQRDRGAATLKWALPLWGCGNFFNPMFRCAQNSQGLFHQLGQQFFGSTYLGIGVLALSIAALGTVRTLRIWLLAAISALALLLALGEQGWVYRGFRAVLPWLGVIRYPVKFVLLAAFTLPLLAGFAAAAAAANGRSARALLVRYGGAACLVVAGVVWTLVETRSQPTPFDQWPLVLEAGIWRCIFVTGTAVAVLLHLILGRGASSRWARAVAPVALLSLVVLDAFVAVPVKNPVLPASVLAPHLWELHQNRAAPRFGEGRAMISPAAERSLLVSQVADLQADVIGKRLALWSHLNLLDGIPKVNGSSTLQTREQKQFETQLYSQTNPPSPRLLDFLNVAYETAPGKVVEWTRRPTPLPLITGGQKPIFMNPTNTFKALFDPAFDLRKTVLLPEELRGTVLESNDEPVEIIAPRISAHRIGFETACSAPSLVVVAQTFYPCWQAFVDGQRIPVWQANYAFQALQVPAGRHEVELIYRDQRFYVGAGVSAIAALVCAGLIREGGRRQGPSGLEQTEARG